MVKFAFIERRPAVFIGFLLLGLLALPAAFGQGSGVADANEHNRRGLEYFNKGHYEHAPRQQATATQTNYRAAEREFRAAVAGDPAFAEAHRNLARVLFVQRDYAGAAEEYRAVISLTADDLDAYVNLALALIELRQPDEAIAALQRAKGRTADEKALAALDAYIARVRDAQAKASR